MKDENNIKIKLRKKLENDSNPFLIEMRNSIY